MNDVEKNTRVYRRLIVEDFHSSQVVADALSWLRILGRNGRWTGRHPLRLGY